MRASIGYKNCLILGESFQRELSGQWVPQYRVMWEADGLPRKTFPSQQYQLSGVFSTDEAADEFAILRAKDWLDSVGAPWLQGQNIEIATQKGE